MRTMFRLKLETSKFELLWPSGPLTEAVNRSNEHRSGAVMIYRYVVLCDIAGIFCCQIAAVPRRRTHSADHDNSAFGASPV